MFILKAMCRLGVKGKFTLSYRLLTVYSQNFEIPSENSLLIIISLARQSTDSRRLSPLVIQSPGPALSLNWKWGSF